MHFLLVINRVTLALSHRFRDMATYSLKFSIDQIAADEVLVAGTIDSL